MDKRILIELANSNPAVQKGVQAIEAQLADKPIMSEDLNHIIKMLEHVLDHPDKYQQMREGAIKHEGLDENMLPPQLNVPVIVSLLVAFYGLRDKLTQNGFAKGGLAQTAQHLQRLGRGGDSILAHINPREAAMLHQMGGSGTINPNTGLPEFKFGWKDIFSAAIPIVSSMILPSVGSAIGGVLGDYLPALSAAIPGGANALGSVLGGAALGAGTSALTGGSALQGGLLGGLSGGLAPMIGSGINRAMGQDFSSSTQNILGSGIVGALGSKLQGKDVLTGAATGAIGGALAGNASNLANKVSAEPGRLNTGISAGATSLGNMLTAGYDPIQAVTGGGLSGLAAGLMYKPSETAVNNVKTANENSQGFQDKMNNVGSGSNQTATTAPEQPVSIPSAQTQGGFDWKNALMMGGLGLAATQMMGGSDQPATTGATGVSTLSPSQQEYFNRPSVSFDWNKIQADAARNNMTVSQYMARHWNDIAAGQYNQPVVAKARGGALNNIAYLAQGSGTGRDDTIPARLSDGEYVIDAETVAMLGDGSNKAGAQKLDQMRREIRKQKGKALAKGKFSPNAKSPLSYLKGA
jgi:hypothetical protein